MKSVKKNLWQKLKDQGIRFYLRHKPATRRQRVLSCVLAVSLLVFLYCGIRIGVRLFEYARDEQNNDAIASLRSASSSNPFDAVTPGDEGDDSSDPSDPENLDVPYEVLVGTDTELNEGDGFPNTKICGSATTT